MRHCDFTEEELRIINHERFYHPDPNVQQRMEILWLKSHGEIHERIAVLAGVSRSTVQRVLDLFHQGRLNAVRQFHWHQRASALDPYRKTLEEEFRERPPHTAAEACDRIEKITGVRRKESQVRKFLREILGMNWRKTAAIPVPPKKSIEEHAAIQAEFLETKLEPRLEEARAQQRTLFFVDAAHFVMGSFLGWLWCAARIFVRSSSGRKRYNVLGACNAVTHELIRVTNDGYINAGSVCELLQKIADLKLPNPVTLVLDNARYQHCQKVQDFASERGIELLFLPSYSPNLNLIERLWKFVKKETLNSRHYQTFEEFRVAIDECLDSLHTDHAAKLDTLLSHKFQTFENVSILAA
jgi:transposase